MKFLFALFLFALLCFTCGSSDPGAEAEDAVDDDVEVTIDETTPNTELPAHVDLPAHTVVMEADSLSGDLNGDGLQDHLVVIETEEETDFGRKRALVVYSEVDGKRHNWYYAPGAVLSSQAGGMMGDPLQGFTVYDNGHVVVDYAGGSREKWTFHHEWRWDDKTNDDFHLVSLRTSAGDPCGEMSGITLDYETGEDPIIGEGITGYDCETGHETGDWAPTGTDMPARPRMKTFAIGENEVLVGGNDYPYYY